ncbi:MAG: heavy metal translocating P-type ATPase metal-binding domain-containing protein [Chitinophagaceae bacterium]
MNASTTSEQVACYHCGEPCFTTSIATDNHLFCCEGCKLVYQLLQQNGLTEYYNLNTSPGQNQQETARKDKFSFLEQPEIQQQLISFTDQQQTYITFYLPQIHCSSCLYLLENMHKLRKGIHSVSVNFTRREANIVFDHNEITLREVADLLARIGYEPNISLHNLQRQKPRVAKHMIYRLGIAGFCFANIMLLSFPEYLGLASAEQSLQGFFRGLNVLLALPVFFYCAYPFFSSGWKGLQNRFLNIDAPIALAILVTFGRSLYEVFTGTGAGYFDSMSGIVFFMLAGRVMQDKTYQHLSFDRDFTSYFPVAVTVLKEQKEVATALPDIKTGDTLLIHHGELIPADGFITRGKAMIDYSFVTGESIPIEKETGEMVYAGGKQTGGSIEMLVMKEVAQSYLTKLWSKDELKNNAEEKSQSFLHIISRYFTWIVFSIALVAGIYWWIEDSSRIWNAVTAVLIVACPCALLLSGTFTNGNILRILARNGLYLRSAQAIEDIAQTTHIVFDKTGTLTTTRQQDVQYTGVPLMLPQQVAIAALATQSTHPLSKALVKYLFSSSTATVTQFTEVPGMGISGVVNGLTISLGSMQFVAGFSTEVHDNASSIYVSIEKELFGRFTIRPQYRHFIPELAQSLTPQYRLSVVSGDNAAEHTTLQKLLGSNTVLKFRQHPEDKLHFIQSLQANGEHVMMIGDGLNDAGALKQSNAGIALAEDTNNFTPASDAIMAAEKLESLQAFIRLCKANKHIILTSFVVSILYNIAGLFFAVQGLLSPMVAAILMPASSLSILLLTYGCSNVIAKRLRL